MTAQIDDVFRYGDVESSLAGISEGVLFDPALFDMKPASVSTACWRGYQAVFALCGSRLVLHTLHVNLLEDGEGYIRRKGPLINGVVPTGPLERHDDFNNHYEGIGPHLEYTGGLLLADGFIEELYDHMGFHPAWKYARVVELNFADGVLQAEYDRSALMDEFRENLRSPRGECDSSRMPTDDEVREFVRRSFDRTYNS